jgi:hypothetical protein
MAELHEVRRAYAADACIARLPLAEEASWAALKPLGASGRLQIPQSALEDLLKVVNTFDRAFMYYAGRDDQQRALLVSAQLISSLRDFIHCTLKDAVLASGNLDPTTIMRERYSSSHPASAEAVTHQLKQLESVAAIRFYNRASMIGGGGGGGGPVGKPRKYRDNSQARGGAGGRGKRGANHSPSSGGHPHQGEGGAVGK